MRPHRQGTEFPCPLPVPGPSPALRRLLVDLLYLLYVLVLHPGLVPCFTVTKARCAEAGPLECCMSRHTTLWVLCALLCLGCK